MRRKELIIKKKLVSLVLVIAVLSCLPVPVSASSSEGEGGLPPWVEEGETWFPVEDIMLLEDLGYCPKQHMAPEGYKLEGYTMGHASHNFDDFGNMLLIASALSGNQIAVAAGTISKAVLDWLQKYADSDLVYFKYVYTREGRLPYNHIIYSAPITNTRYDYVSCETHYGVSDF